MRSLSLLLLCTLAACAKKHEGASGEAPPPAEVAPVTPEEVSAIKSAIRFGHGIGPDEVVKPAAPAACGDFVAQLPGFVAGTLSVPEDWEHPDASPKIKLFYYWRKGEGAAASRPPVVFFNGGPAEDSHGSGQLLAPLGFTGNSPFVLFDQRGTGCSTAFPAGATEANAQRLTKWASLGIVGDAEALRQHLFGARKWRVYGQSYGGFLVHRYLELHPDSVDRAIAHGFSVMQDPLAWVADRVRSQQRVGANFFAKYPGDQAALAAIRAEIPAKLCWKSGADSICGPAVLDSFTILLGFQSDWENLHQWIQSLRDKSGQLNRKYLDQAVRAYVFGVYGAGGLGGDVISKMEIVPGYDDRTSCQGALAQLRAAGENPEDYPINECRLLMTYQKPNFELMKNVTAQPLPLDRIAANLAEKGAPEFFLFSGQQDVFVPVATFDEEVKRLGTLVHYESFPNSGHEGFYTEPHVTAAVTGTE